MGKRILGWGAVLVVLITLGFITFHTRPEPVQSFRKPDGSVVTLLGVTYGSNHTMVSGKSYQRSLYKILPGKLKSLSGARVYSTAGSQTNVPMIWLLESSPVTNLLAPSAARPGSGLAMRLAFAGQPDNDVSVRVLDEFGCEYEPRGFSVGRNWSQNEVVSHYQLDAGDPHGGIAGFCIYDSDVKTNRIGTFLIPGKALLSIEKTNVTSAPVQDGELTFQLTSLLTGMKSAPFSFFKTNKTVLFSQAAFRVEKNGKLAPGWFVNSLQITDTHGKVIKWLATTHGYKGDDAIFNLDVALEPTNEPFKLRVEFQNRTIFSPEEEVTFKDVPFPDAAETLVQVGETNVLGWRLSLENIYGRLSQKPTNYFLGNQTLVDVRLTPATNTAYLQLVRAVDEGGNEILRSAAVPKGKGVYYFSFGPNAKARSMTLTFAVHKSHFVEFEATPVVVATNAVAKN